MTRKFSVLSFIFNGNHSGLISKQMNHTSSYSKIGIFDSICTFNQNTEENENSYHVSILTKIYKVKKKEEFTMF